MSDLDAARHKAAMASADLIDAASDEFIAQHEVCIRELTKLGLILGRQGLPPFMVLGQMQQPVAVAFTDHIMANYVPKGRANAS